MTTIMSFTASNYPVADCVAGSTITMKADVSAATDADAGSYHVVLMLNSASGEVFEMIVGTFALATAPVTVSCSYKLPITLAAGAYRTSVSVRNTAAWVWQHVAQTASAF